MKTRLAALSFAVLCACAPPNQLLREKKATTPPPHPPSPPAPTVAPPALAEITEGDRQMAQLLADLTGRGDSWRKARTQCLAEAGCPEEGRCSWNGEKCVARTLSDCLWSEACARDARCAPEAGACVGPRHAQAEAHRDDHGRLVVLRGRVRAFVLGGAGFRITDHPSTATALQYSLAAQPKNLFDMRWSARCGGRPSCGSSVRRDAPHPPLDSAPLRHGVDRPSPYADWFADLLDPPERWLARRDACGDTEGCFLEGRCSQVASSCQAVRITDCLVSDVCAREGRCLPQEGLCKAGGSALLDALSLDIEGQTSREYLNQHVASLTERVVVPLPHQPSSRLLLAANLIDCRHSEACWAAGRCHFDTDRCVAATHVGCAHARQCKDGGCTLRDGQCLVSVSRDATP